MFQFSGSKYDEKKIEIIVDCCYINFVIWDKYDYFLVEQK